ncbi:MAG: class I tRNA ligase family protein [Verrucomicrobiae bacterium]|nr:class I tRNA ligase family protein [Verrucomicrobiae bacterium]
MRKQYPFDLIESKWQRYWLQQATFRAFDPGESIAESHPFRQRHRKPRAPSRQDPYAPRFYVLDMFPYPSGAGLHVGHPEGYTATDILARYQRMRGRHVLHPMGWDAFGLPAEQYAIKSGQHPRKTTEQNIATFRGQIRRLGFSYDWQREVDTTDPKYYQWTQWIFLQLYHSWFNPATRKAEPISTYQGPDPDSVRLAYVAEAPVNWCPALGTVLANEEVIDGKSEVGGHPVERRPMRQWMLRITAYAERLIEDLDLVNWPEGIKLLQRNWIGRSEGAFVDFVMARGGQKLTVFTTRPDTLFGATYMVLAPEHPLVDQIAAADARDAIASYRKACGAKSDQDRQLAKDKTGVFTGAFAVNPVNNQSIPIWIADYVMMGYGTGAIMAVPAHDERDWEFAQKFKIPIIQVVKPADPATALPFVDDGVSMNSDFISGLPTAEAKKRITSWLEEKGLGKRAIQYKLRDWLFSRQRYWGEPFPITWDASGKHHAVDAASLPVDLPAMTDFKPTGTTEPPLSKAAGWVTLPNGARRETNTMPQWAGSCWYYLRYLDPRNNTAFCAPEKADYWIGPSATSTDASNVDRQTSSIERRASSVGGVDLYVGGTEHAVLHLLYARFWHKVIFDLGHVSTPEPFQRLVNQGLILGEDGQKMSKSRGNVVNPDVIIGEYGADSMRLYEMFMGPLEQTKPWSTTGVEGVYRFLGRAWRLLTDETSVDACEQQLTLAPSDPAERETLLATVKPHALICDAQPAQAQLVVLHRTIQKVTADLDAMAFNTAISALMVFVNEAMTWPNRPKAVMKPFILLLAPFAPHLAEELWRIIGETNTLAYAPWPSFDPAYLQENEVEVVIQINGKVREKLRVPTGLSQDELRQRAIDCPRLKELLAGKTIRKTIVVPNKLVNLVAG